jgi:hypothetical protein
MMGNGLGPGTIDVGNLIVVSGGLLAEQGVPALPGRGVALFLLLGAALLAVPRLARGKRSRDFRHGDRARGGPVAPS